jgi:hypothetical protein
MHCILVSKIALEIESSDLTEVQKKDIPYKSTFINSN